MLSWYNIDSHFSAGGNCLTYYLTKKTKNTATGKQKKAKPHFANLKGNTAKVSPSALS